MQMQKIIKANQLVVMRKQKGRVKMKFRSLSFFAVVCLVLTLATNTAFAASDITDTISEGNHLKFTFSVDENGNITVLDSGCMPLAGDSIPGMILAFKDTGSTNKYTLEFYAQNLVDLLYTNRIYIRVVITGDTGYQAVTTLNESFNEKVLLAGQTWPFPSVVLPAGHTYTMEITNMTIPLYDRYGAYLDPSTYDWAITLLDIKT